MSQVAEKPSYKQQLKVLIEELGTMLPQEKFAVFNNDATRLASQYPAPLK